MKQFNLDEFLKNRIGVVTRNGLPVRIEGIYFSNPEYPVKDVVDNHYTKDFTADGLLRIGEETEYDLFFAFEKHEGWMNIYQDDVGYFGKHIFQRKEDAEMTACSNRIALAKVEWEE